MTVYAVMESDNMLKLYQSIVDAFKCAKYLADKKEEECRQAIANGEDITVTRKDNQIIVEDPCGYDYDEVWNYWVKSVDVLNKF